MGLLLPKGEEAGLVLEEMGKAECDPATVYIPPRGLSVAPREASDGEKAEGT